MKGTIHDVDAQRARWLRYRSALGLVLDAGSEFALGGLARHMENLDVRFLALPADPEADAVALDAETLGWLQESREAPFGGAGPNLGYEHRATSSALVLAARPRDDSGWDRYLALHRHGGIELASPTSSTT